MVRTMGRAVVLLAVFSLPLQSQTITSIDVSGKQIRRKCQASVTPRSLPAAGAIVDSAALVLAASPQRLQGTVSVMYTADGSLYAIRPLVEGDEGVALAEAVRGALRPSPVGGSWAVRLSVVFQPSGEPVLRAERALYRPPDRNSERTISRVGTVRVVTVGPAGQGPPRIENPVAEVELSETGRVIGIRLERRSGLSEIDQEFEQLLRSGQWLPAQFDWMPVPSVYRTDGRQEKR